MSRGVFMRAVNTHLRRFGGDPIEALSDAGLLFVEAYDSHDPELGDFDDHLDRTIRNGLRNCMRTYNKIVRRKRLLPHDPEASVDDAPARRVWDMRTVIEGLSSDAAETVIVALEACTFSVSNRNTAASGRIAATKQRRIVVKELRRRGWCLVRIQQAFDEVREAL